jgi:hypothetical protein
MHPWFGWIRWINPIFYAFEILVANEFHGREFTCTIHQPNAILFQQFDRLLFMAKGGKTVYFGDVGSLRAIFKFRRPRLSFASLQTQRSFVRARRTSPRSP